MDYNEFINLKRPVKRIALIGGNFQIFKQWCDDRLAEWEDGNDMYAGYEFNYCSSPEHVYGTRFHEYRILPRTENWNDVYLMIEYIKHNPNYENYGM